VIHVECEAGTMKNTQALLLLLTLASVLMPLQAEVNFASWGGAYETSQQKAYVDSWKGGEVVFHKYTGGLEQIREQVKSGDVAWDIVDVLPHDARQGCDEGLFEELNRDLFQPAADGTPMDDDVMVEVPNDCVVPLTFWSYVAFYQQGTYQGAQPSSISDFFDPEKFPGKRGIRSWPDGLIEMALVADGVAIHNVYKVMSTKAGIDQAFRVLDRIRDQRVFWHFGKEPIDLVKSGEVAMSLAYNGRIGAAVLTRGEKFITLWDGQVLQEEWLVMLKGAPNKDEALDFLIHSSAPQQQAAQARYINYGPMRASAFDIILAGEPWFHNGKNIMEHMPNRPELMSRTIVANPEWWADNGASIAERYAAWMITD
jgi:putative spermidine/putrescine transport system substrate-binding protein